MDGDVRDDASDASRAAVDARGAGFSLKCRRLQVPLTPLGAQPARETGTTLPLTRPHWGNSGCFSPGKASSHSTALRSFFSSSSFSCVSNAFVFPYHRLSGLFFIFILRQTDMGSLTCAHISSGCVPYTRRWNTRMLRKTDDWL